MGVTEDEQARLDAYNAQGARRARFEAQRKAGLSGSTEAKAQFDARWEPLQRWLVENGSHEHGGEVWT